MNKLLELIKLHKDDFFQSVSNRMYSSVYNKDKHSMVLSALVVDDYKLLEELLSDIQYRKPLEGVIYCMECEFEIECKFIHAYASLGEY